MPSKPGPGSVTHTRTVSLGYRSIDADNHYYETRDAFTRHIEKRFADRSLCVVKDDEGNDVVNGKIGGGTVDLGPGRDVTSLALTRPYTGSLLVAGAANIVAANQPPAAATTSDDIQTEAEFMGFPPCVFYDRRKC